MSTLSTTSIRSLFRSNKNLFYLVIGRSFARIAVGLLSVFLPVFLFQKFGGSFSNVALYYLFGSLPYVLLMPFGAKLFERLGTRTSMIIGTSCAILFYLILSFESAMPMWVFMVSSLGVLQLNRLLFWLPFHIDFAMFTSHGKRGVQMGLWHSAMTIIGVIAPILAAFLIGAYSFKLLFIIAVGLYLVSIYWYAKTPQSYHEFSWSYFETWKNLFKGDRRMDTASYFAEGAESGVGLVIWPIFIYQVFQGNLLQVGLVSSLVVGITVILQIIIGKYIDGGIEFKKKMLKHGGLLYAAGWFLKVFIATALHVFVFDVYHKISRVFMRIPFDTLTYDIAAHQGQYIDEFTVAREMALHGGRCVVFCVAILMSLIAPLSIVFIFGALASVAISLVQQKRITEARV